MSSRAAQQALRVFAMPSEVELFQRFFKTGKGEYGEGDCFIGVKVPHIRKVAKAFSSLALSECEKLLNSKIHEERLLALLILELQFKAGDAKDQKKIYDFYLRKMDRINNWDLVDCSAYHIVGGYLFQRPRGILIKMAQSKELWVKRIAIIATFHFIKKNDFEDTLKISKILLQDEHDLIHKAVGWMLREVGKRDLKTEEVFLKSHYQSMPRTMLRYAIEKFPEKKRLAYLKNKI